MLCWRILEISNPIKHTHNSQTMNHVLCKHLETMNLSHTSRYCLQMDKMNPFQSVTTKENENCPDFQVVYFSQRTFLISFVLFAVEFTYWSGWKWKESDRNTDMGTLYAFWSLRSRPVIIIKSSISNSDLSRWCIRERFRKTNNKIRHTIGRDLEGEQSTMEQGVEDRSGFRRIKHLDSHTRKTDLIIYYHY